MQKPNFPNSVYQLSASPGKSGEGIRVRITKIPAKFNAKSVSTLSGRRLGMDMFDKVNIFAMSDRFMTVTSWVKEEENIQNQIDRMHSFIRGTLQKRLEETQTLLLGTVGKPEVLHRDYCD